MEVQHLAVRYKKLRQELCTLFLRSHYFNLYSIDVESVNEIKGQTWYIMSLTLCCFLAWNYFYTVLVEDSIAHSTP